MAGAALSSSARSEQAAAGHFPDFTRRNAAATLGMWMFLATELLLFGGLFLAYTIYRLTWPDEFAAASGHLQIVPGVINTTVLLTSSLFMALSVHAAEQGFMRLVRAGCIATMALGLVFLSIKGYEYHHELQSGLVPMLGLPFHYEGANPGAARLFFGLYLLMTGLHALHLFIGILLVGAVTWRIRRMSCPPVDTARLRMTGLYWHLVDVVWLFLFPLLYLIERHG